jgi:hypothetical protein
MLDPSLEEHCEGAPSVPFFVRSRASTFCERDRRIDVAEEARTIEVLQRRAESAPTLERRAEAEGLSLMFELGLRTAMRKREIYTLQQAEIRIADKTIYLNESKNGDRRQVPLNSKARAVLEIPRPGLEAARRDGNLFHSGMSGWNPRHQLQRPPGCRDCSPMISRKPVLGAEMIVIFYGYTAINYYGSKATLFYGQMAGQLYG